jgi:SAM-dependent methyltransferase
MAQTHDDEVRRQFTQQAARFAEEGRPLASAEYLRWVVGQLDLRPEFRVLDVATGTGHLGRAIAPRVHQVTAVDLTPAMLDQGRLEAQKAGLGNIVFEQGRAEKLPYPDDWFDLVVTRLSLHHFADPYPAIGEMARVCRPGRQVAIMDMVSPGDPSLSASYNHLERLRDPSHTRCLTLEELRQGVLGAGLSGVQMVARDIEVNLGQWLDLTGAGPDVRQVITAELQRELDGAGVTGMRPFVRAGALMFTQTWATAVAAK